MPRFAEALTVSKRKSLVWITLFDNLCPRYRGDWGKGEVQNTDAGKFSSYERHVILRGSQSQARKSNSFARPRTPNSVSAESLSISRSSDISWLRYPFTDLKAKLKRRGQVHRIFIGLIHYLRIRDCRRTKQLQRWSGFQPNNPQTLWNTVRLFLAWDQQARGKSLVSVEGLMDSDENRHAAHVSSVSRPVGPSTSAQDVELVTERNSFSTATSTKSPATSGPQEGTGVESVELGSRGPGELEHTITPPNHTMATLPPATTPATSISKSTAYAASPPQSRYPSYSVLSQRSQDSISRSDHTARVPLGRFATDQTPSPVIPSGRSAPITPRRKSAPGKNSPQSSSPVTSNLDTTSSQGSSNVSFNNGLATSPLSAGFSPQSGAPPISHALHPAWLGSSELETASYAGKPRAPARGTAILPDEKVDDQSPQVSYNLQVMSRHDNDHHHQYQPATEDVRIESTSGVVAGTSDIAGGQEAQHTVVYGGSPCPACLAAREGGREDGGFYGPNVPPEDRQWPWHNSKPTS